MTEQLTLHFIIYIYTHTYIYAKSLHIYMDHFTVHTKLSQHCKSIILQLRQKLKRLAACPWRYCQYTLSLYPLPLPVAKSFRCVLGPKGMQKRGISSRKHSREACTPMAPARRLQLRNHCIPADGRQVCTFLMNHS